MKIATPTFNLTGSKPLIPLVKLSKPSFKKPKKTRTPSFKLTAPHPSGWPVQP